MVMRKSLDLAFASILVTTAVKGVTDCIKVPHTPAATAAQHVVMRALTTTARCNILATAEQLKRGGKIVVPRARQCIGGMCVAARHRAVVDRPSTYLQLLRQQTVPGVAFTLVPGRSASMAVQNLQHSDGHVATTRKE